jgi:hypothetical protein
MMPHAALCKDVRNRFGRKPSDYVKNHELKKLVRGVSSNQA